MSGVTFYPQAKLIVETKANILAKTPAAGRMAYATDTLEFYLYDGTNWKVMPLELKTEAAAPDMGVHIGGGLSPTSDKQGYYEEFITDKDFYNITIKGSARTAVGGLRIDTTQDPDLFEVYLRDAWQTIIYDLTTEDGDFRHSPVGEEIYVWRGDSVLLGLNDQPIVQEYNASMGAYPPYRILDGGDF